MASIVGEKLKFLVKRTGREQKEIGIELGLKLPTFNGYVNGKRNPTYELMNQFADYFHVSVDFLTGHSKVENPYLEHMTDEEKDFLNNSANYLYIQMAMDIKSKTYANYTENVLQKVDNTVKKKSRKSGA